ncbi:MAG: (2Fe-2S)-binding protein [Clostridia bacterium]|nr:(2Fe-2S)-binding protein [Deltaproteobacteria bacterium]
MKSVTLTHTPDPVLVRTESRVLDVLLASKTSVLMACGGKGLCATCHVYVEEGAQNLTPMTPRERLSLKILTNVRPSSRLACQAKVVADGVKVAMPRGRYIVGTADLDALIGRRAEEPVLHPVDGRTLIQAGKIITRSRIEELKFVDVDVAEMHERSLSIHL